MGAEMIGERGVDEIAGVGGAHLEEDAVVEVAHRGAFEGAFEGDGGVGPEDVVQAEGGAVGEEFGELFVGLRRFGFAAAAEAEIVLLAAENAVALESEDEQVDSGAGGGVVGLALLQCGGEFVDGVGDFAERDNFGGVGDGGEDAFEEAEVAGIGGGAVEEIEECVGGSVLCSEGDDHGGEDGDGGFFLLSDEQGVGADLAAEEHGAGVFDGDGLANVGGD